VPAVTSYAASAVATTSVSPDATTTASYRCAQATAVVAMSSYSPTDSTPRTDASSPASDAISP